MAQILQRTGSTLAEDFVKSNADPDKVETQEVVVKEMEKEEEKKDSSDSDSLGMESADFEVV